MRRRALTWGLAVAAAYLLAVGAGQWFKVGPGLPLLDGVAPILPYRWVSPPPVLSPGNQPPQPQTFTLTMGKNGSDPQVISTSDLQLTIVLGTAAIPPRAGSTSAQLEVTPLAPSSVGALPHGLVVAGNVYHLAGTYQGDGPVPPLRRREPVTMSYPAVPIPVSSGHVEHHLVWSVDGKTWKVLQTSDSRKNQLAEAAIDQLGYVGVAIPREEADGLLGSPTPSPTPAGGAGGGSSGLLPFVPVVGLVVVGIVVAALAVRSRRKRSAPPPRASRGSATSAARHQAPRNRRRRR